MITFNILITIPITSISPKSQERSTQISSHHFAAGVSGSLSFILERTTSANAAALAKLFFSEEWEEGGLSVFFASGPSLSSSEEYWVIVRDFRRFARRTIISVISGIHILASIACLSFLRALTIG